MSEFLKAKLLAMILLSLPGPLLYVFYRVCFYDTGFFLFESRAEIASVISAFCFTMIGFLAAILTIVITQADKPAIKDFHREGLTSILTAVYLYTIATLFLTFFAAILSHGMFAQPALSHAVLALFINSLFSVGAVSIGIFMLARKALAQ